MTTIAIGLDHPLKPDGALAADKLNRAPFARAAVGALNRVSSTEGFVLAIEGPWGSGKTSVLAMMQDALQQQEGENPVFVHFNPWLFGDRDALLRQFFAAISTALRMKDHAADAQKAADALVNYAKVFDFIGFIPGAEPFTGPVRKVIESAGNAARGVATQKDRDLAGKRQMVETALSAFTSKIYVFIDDIDRLYPNEVFEMIRIIKTIGELPNIGYVLAMDSNYVEMALAGAKVPQSATYVDKIVQVRLPIPTISAEIRQRLLDDGLSALDQGAFGNFFKDSSDRMSQLYFHGLKDLLEHPRDVVRVVNTLSVIEPGLRGEIVLADLLGWACLMVKAPRIYEEIGRHPYFFSGQRPDFGEVTDAEKEAWIAKMSQLFESTRNPRAVKQLVYHLFPEVASIAGEIPLSQASDVDGHIGTPGRLNIALGMAIGTADVSLIDAKNYIGDPAARLVVMRRLNGDNSLGFLEMVGDVAQSATIEELGDLASLAIAVARLLDALSLQEKLPPMRFFGITPDNLARRAIRAAVKVHSGGDTALVARLAGETAYHVVVDPLSLTLAADILLSSGSERREVGELICDTDRQAEAAAQLAQNVIAALDEGRFWDIANPARVIWALMRYAKPSWPAVIDAFKQDDPNLDKFALQFLRHSYSSNGGQSYALPDEERLAVMDVKWFIEHAKKRLEDPTVKNPLKAAWRSVVEGKNLYGATGAYAGD